MTQHAPTTRDPADGSDHRPDRFAAGSVEAPAGPLRGDRTALVIGAGFGGIASALRLRAMGFDVTLADRLPELGGRARVFNRDGFTFDAGPTVITAPYLLDELFQLFGERLSDHVRLEPVWPWYRIAWEDGASFDYGGDPDQMCEEIARFDRRDQDGYRAMLAQAQEIYRIGYEQLGDQPFDRLTDMVATIPDMIRLRTHRSMYSFVASHIRNERLRQVFTFQPLLVGGNPFHTSCIYGLIQPLEQRFGVYYAMGGTGAIINALAGLMDRVGIATQLNADIEKLETSGSRVTGAKLADGSRLGADVVVSNADPVTLYREMLGSGKRHARTRSRAKRMKLSMGLFVSYFGTSREYPELAHHTILLSDRYKLLLEDIFRGGRIPDDPSIYLHAPTRTDPSMAPAGSECMYALAPVPNLSHGADWDTTLERYEELVLRRIENWVAPGLRDSLATCFSLTPKYFETELRSPQGAGFSIQPTLTQSAYFRFHNRCPHYRNLFLVGAGTHPGAGIPGTLCTAKTMERAMRREGLVANAHAEAGASR